MFSAVKHALFLFIVELWKDGSFPVPKAYVMQFCLEKHRLSTWKIIHFKNVWMQKFSYEEVIEALDIAQGISVDWTGSYSEVATNCCNNEKKFWEAKLSSFRMIRQRCDSRRCYWQFGCLVE